MEPQKNLIEPLMERVEAYGKTSLELLRLKTLAKTADVTSSLLSRSLFILLVSLFVFTLNIAVALWIGDLLGKNYYGFFIVAGFYALVSVILLIVHPSIKKSVSNTIIKQLFN
jgi:pheromone shutdown protein TraB